MKPINVNSILVTGSQSPCISSLLLEGAIHFAQQGYPVLYLSAKEFQSLPPALHGLTRPTPDVFSLIRFMYLSRWQDLLQHLFSLHMHTHVPSVVIVEALEHFFSSNKIRSRETRAPYDAAHIALVFAALLDGAAVCAKRSNSKVHLIVSFGQEVPRPLIDLFFSSVVNVFENAEQKDGQRKQDVLVQNFERTISLQFLSQSGSFVLCKVSFWENLLKISN